MKLYRLLRGSDMSNIFVEAEDSQDACRIFNKNVSKKIEGLQAVEYTRRVWKRKKPVKYEVHSGQSSSK